MFCRSLFVPLYFFFWPLCCLFYFNIRILITHLVSSNSSSISCRYHIGKGIRCTYTGKLDIFSHPQPFRCFSAMIQDVHCICPTDRHIKRCRFPITKGIGSQIYMIFSVSPDAMPLTYLLWYQSSFYLTFCVSPQTKKCSYLNLKP